MNRLLATVLMAAAVVALPMAAMPQAGPDNTLRVAVESLGNEVLDPILGPVSSTKLYLPLMYDSLIGTDKTNSIISKDTGAARDWQISGGGKIYTFFIRKGIKFSNGDDLTADDVKFSLERAYGPRSVASFSGSLKKAIDNIVVVDPYTVRVTLKAARFSFLQDVSALIGAESMIVPKKYIEKVGDTAFAAAPIGSGPYKLKKYLPGQAIQFEAIPNHWYIGQPKYAEVDIMSIPEEGTRLTMLRGDQADVISVGRQYAADLQKGGFVIATKAASHQMHLIINNQWEKNSPLNNKKIRQAMNLAIDRKTILDKLMLGSGELTQCWTVDAGYATRPKGLCDVPKYDPKAAAQLVKDAGYPNGVDITFDEYPVSGIPEQVEVDQAVANYFRAVGIRANVRLTEYGAYRAQWPKPESHPNTVTNHSTVSQVIIGSLIQNIWGDGLLSTTRGVNPAADKAIDAMLNSATIDEYARNEYIAWRALLNDSNAVMLFAVDSKYAANPKKVAGPWATGTSTADIGLRWLVNRKIR